MRGRKGGAHPVSALSFWQCGQAVVIKSANSTSSWVAQSVKHQTLDFGSGHDLRVVRSSPTSGSVLTAWSLLGILSLPPPSLSLSK